MSDIIFENVSKKYNEEIILKDFSYTFSQGNIYCVMGDSGMGKTTILSIMLGVQNASTGRVYSEGDFSVVFQENRLVEELSAAVNVKMVLKGRKELEAAAELKKLLPENAIYKKCRELSGGMKRRVAVVRAMMHPSDYIVMDEPFTGLDDETKKRTMDYILDMRKDRTLIFVTHDEEDAKYMNATICLLTRE